MPSPPLSTPVAYHHPSPILLRLPPSTTRTLPFQQILFHVSPLVSRRKFQTTSATLSASGSARGACPPGSYLCVYSDERCEPRAARCVPLPLVYPKPATSRGICCQPSLVVVSFVFLHRSPPTANFIERRTHTRFDLLLSRFVPVHIFSRTRNRTYTQSLHTLATMKTSACVLPRVSSRTYACISKIRCTLCNFSSFNDMENI